MWVLGLRSRPLAPANRRPDGNYGMRKGRFSCYLLGFVALAGLAREYEGTSRNQLDRNRIRGVCLGEPSTVGQSRTKKLPTLARRSD